MRTYLDQAIDLQNNNTMLELDEEQKCFGLRPLEVSYRPMQKKSVGDCLPMLAYSMIQFSASCFRCAAMLPHMYAPASAVLCWL